MSIIFSEQSHTSAARGNFCLCLLILMIRQFSANFCPEQQKQNRLVRQTIVKAIPHAKPLGITKSGRQQELIQS